MSRQKEKQLKREIRKQEYANEGKETQRGFFTFGLFLIALGVGYGYICHEAKATDLVPYMGYPVGFGLLLIVVGNLVNKKHQKVISNYEQYEQQRKASKRI